MSAAGEIDHDSRLVPAEAALLEGRNRLVVDRLLPVHPTVADAVDAASPTG